ncbi:MAG: 4-(cytidine 5'-diphospho)-2-C-methyl-D-erythritol kinase [Bacteroides sp.]|nr:4-(cytidine 5'-diphospho)-2-C-methyl-D-erythritol kinase [Bacteroides sp.]
MIYFVNAKINLGLDIVGRRPDGYHLLETAFYPIGVHNGTPANPEPFGDVLELTPGLRPESGYVAGGAGFIFTGRRVDCQPEKNLIVKAVNAIMNDYSDDERLRVGEYTLILDKHIPDGAGLGGGSADATFTLRAVNDYACSRGVRRRSDAELERLALGLGADCPVFVRNVPAYAEGIGERLEPIGEILKGCWAVTVKPDLHISTREAFSGVTPARPSTPLRSLLRLPLAEWRGRVRNAFEDSLFPLYPELEAIKEAIYGTGAAYASLTGSGAALYGIYGDADAARAAYASLADTVEEKVKLRPAVNLSAL